MKNIVKSNIVKLLGIFLIGIIAGWYLNNYYYINFYEPSSYLQDLMEDQGSNLTRIDPVSCTASSQLNDYQSCERLYDLDSDGWEDNNQNCKDQWIELDLGKEYLVEFIVLQNYEYEGLFAQKDKIRDFDLVLSNGVVVSNTMVDSTDSQWFDIVENTSTIRMNIQSSWNTIGTETCHLQEFEIYGRSNY
jgi:hypothetical protein